MSSTPIDSLKKMMESDRDKVRNNLVMQLLIKQYGPEKTREWIALGNYKYFNDDKRDLEKCFDIGHEAATARLLGLLNKALEVIEKYEPYCVIITKPSHHPDFAEFKEVWLAREFLTTLADASGEMKKESKY